MKVAVFGAGAVGSYLGSCLAKAGAGVHLIARGKHLDALRRSGLTLVTPRGSETVRVAATDDPAGVGIVDVVLFAVKAYDTESAARRLKPLLGLRTAVVSLQNGIENEDQLAAIIGPDHVVPMAVYILAAIEEPGVVRSGPARVVLGEYSPGPPSKRVDDLAEMFRLGGVEAEVTADVRVAKWQKYTLLVGFSAVSAASQLPLGSIRQSPAAVAMMRAVMQEAFEVATALGVALPDDQVERSIGRVLAQADSEGASLRNDLLKGRRMELDALQGALIRLGRQAGVPTPWTEAAYAILEPWAIKNGSSQAGNPDVARLT
ncbi:MAG TPA: 2-dehydropantoate 2-reductase [Candidatus Limnocylindrales bacterium]|nr:2-dehydropantoate 2-reductase [Candidatus Limnocylindrales bacterium]